MSEMLIESGLRPERDFTLIANDLITDCKISADAFRIMAYLLSKPPIWRANEKDISRQLGLVDQPGKRSKVYTRAIRELKQAGYLEIRKGGKGFSTWKLKDPTKTDAPQKEASIQSDAPQKGASPKGSIPKREHGSKTLGFSKTVSIKKKENPVFSLEEEKRKRQSQSQNQSAGRKPKIPLHLRETKAGNLVVFYRSTPLYEYPDDKIVKIARANDISEEGCQTYDALRQRIEDKVWDEYESQEGSQHG